MGYNSVAVPTGVGVNGISRHILHALFRCSYGSAFFENLTPQDKVAMQNSFRGTVRYLRPPSEIEGIQVHFFPLLPVTQTSHPRSCHGISAEGGVRSYVGPTSRHAIGT